MRRCPTGAKNSFHVEPQRAFIDGSDYYSPVKLVIALKNDFRRKQFVERFHNRDIARSDFHFCLAIISLIKDESFPEAMQLHSEVMNRAGSLDFFGDDPRDIFEYVAVLWAQYERVSDSLSKEQAVLINSLFDAIGGKNVFSAFATCSISPQSRKQPRVYHMAPLSRNGRDVFLVTRANAWESGLSRPSDITLRLKESFTRGGWRAHLIAPERITEVRGQSGSPSPLVILDIESIGAQKAVSLLEKAPASSRKVALYLDMSRLTPGPEWDACHELSDVVWCSSHSADQEEWLSESGKWTDFPIPVGLTEETRLSLVHLREKSRDWKPLFVGSIERTNLPRIIYLINSKIRPSFIFQTTTAFAGDSAAPLGYIDYLKALCNSRVNLDLSQRYSGLHQITGRINEVIATKGLLIREHCHTVSAWYTAGEHFLSFSNLAELEAITEELLVKPPTYNDIARNAYDYYCKNYTEQCLTAHLSTFLE